MDKYMELHGKRVNATGKPNCVIYMSGALEVGDSPAEGRTGHHFHFVVVTKNRTTMSAVRKQFPQCDVRPLRGTIAEGDKYLNGHKKAGFKEPLRREILGDPPADKQGKGKGSHHMDEILAAIDDGTSLPLLEREFFGDFVRYGSSLREMYVNITQQKIRKRQLERYSNVVWRNWQADCLTMITTELETPNSRAIHWWYEETGSAGKSWLAGYLQLKYDAICLDAARKADLAYAFLNAISQTDVKVVVLDFVRTTQPSEDGGTGITTNFLHNVFAFLENIKNGNMLVSKYQSRTIRFDPPVVVCFANWAPPRETMSADRWNVVKIVKPLTGY